MQELSVPQLVAVFAVPIVFAITVHEVAHGWVARLLGDRTAELLGRLTLNPVKHVDLVGTLIVPAVLLFLHAPIFGWAKPVPVASRNLRRPRQDMAIVAAAGPASNLVMAIGWVVVARAARELGGTESGMVMPLVYAMGLAGIWVNVTLAALNILPIPPLDGGRVLNGFLPPRISDKFERLEPFGLIILVLLLWQGALVRVLAPIINTLVGLLIDLGGIPGSDLARVLG
jgi:Zn-dependent protease